MTLLPDIIGATAAGCASTILGHPLDTIKVHLQTQKAASPKSTTGSIFQVARDLVRSEGPMVFWRGMGPPLFNAILMNTVMFSVFHKVQELSGHNSLLAGLISGIVTACISTPTDYIKIQSQLYGIDSLSVLKKNIIRSQPTVLFRGHVANLGREGIFTMVYLGLYYEIISSSIGDTTLNGANPPNLLWVTFISSMTGGLAWVASYPLDTIKTVLQSSSSSDKKKKSWSDVIRQTGGLSALYRGCGASTGRAMLVTSTRMLVYEGIRGLFVSF